MKYLIIMSLLIFPMLGISQAPQRINFQSVLRNTTGEVISNSSVSLRISILRGTTTGTLVYSETHAKMTDAGGLMSLQIGSGTLPSTDFAAIDWGGSAHFIKLEADFSGGNNYVLLGTQELMSVPYALYASYASKTDTSVLNLASRFSPLNNKLNIIDTSTMLSNYRTGLNNKLNTIDTSTMLLNYKTELSSKVNNADTSDMLNPYLRKADAVVSVETDPVFNNSVAKGITGIDTAYWNRKLNLSDTSNMLANYRTGLNNKVNTADTSNMLTNYRTGLNNKLNIIDTSTMLSKYLRKSDTTSLSDRINTKLNSSDFPNGTNTGNMLYWNGTRWVNLAFGSGGQVLMMSSGLPEWGTITVTVSAFICGTTISDIDGNSYNTVLIGAQCWTKENLRVRRYNNGTSILFDANGGSGGSSSTWQSLTIGAHTIYANDSTTTPSNRTKYGYLYNWYAAKGIYTTGVIAITDPLNICPSGWHVPTDAEWTTLTTNLGGESVAGGKMKSVGTAYWNSPNTGATNESGFSALPGGLRNDGGVFLIIGERASFWSATENDEISVFAWYRDLNVANDDVFIHYPRKSFGASVRCLRD